MAVAGKNVESQARSLQEFVEVNPCAHCLCTGRPHTIVDRFWHEQFEHDDWQFVQVDTFTADQARDVALRAARQSESQWEKGKSEFHYCIATLETRNPPWRLALPGLLPLRRADLQRSGRLLNEPPRKQRDNSVSPGSSLSSRS